MRPERERGRPDVLCVTDRQTDSLRVLHLHTFVDKLEYNKFPLFVNFDIRELDVSTLFSTH